MAFLSRLLFVPMLGAAVAAPLMMADDGGWGSQAKSRLGGLWPGSSQQTDLSWLDDQEGWALADMDDPDSEVLGDGAAGRAPMAGPPVKELTEVLRFDVSPRWVIDRWPRVSTALADLELEGMRVPLVTGSQVDDLAGSLTYYFDRYEQVQRIRFHGHTGDEGKLVEVVSRHYGLRPSPALGLGLHLATWNGIPTNVLRVKRAAVVRAEDRHRHLEVMLELNRPGVRFGLSPEARQVLEQDRGSRRW